MRKSKPCLALITAILLMVMSVSSPGIAVNVQYIAKVQVDDSWAFDDGTEYNVSDEYAELATWAHPDHLESFQVEVDTTSDPFFSELYWLEYFQSDGGSFSGDNSIIVSLTNVSFDHRLLTQRGSYFAYESGSGNLEMNITTYRFPTEPRTNVTASVNFTVYIDSDDDPSISVILGQPITNTIIVEFWGDNVTLVTVNENAMALPSGLTFERTYIPSEPFLYDFKGQNITVVNVTASLTLKSFDFPGFQMADNGYLWIETWRRNGDAGGVETGWTPTVVANESRIFSYDIGLPLYQKVDTPALSPSLLVKMLPSGFVTERYLQEWQVADEQLPEPISSITTAQGTNSSDSIITTVIVTNDSSAAVIPMLVTIAVLAIRRKRAI